MIQQTTLRMRPQGASAPWNSLGSAMHAVFLDLVRRQDPEAAQRLHDHPGVKPYALRIGKPGVDGETTWEWLALEAEAARAMQRALAQLPVLVTPGGHGVELRPEDTGHAEPGLSYADLVRQAEANEAQEFVLRFESPTAFRQHGNYVPLPIPRLMLGSYLERWNAFSGMPLPSAWLDVLESHLRLGGVDIRSRGDRMGKVMFTGFMGEVRLTFAPKTPEEVARALRILLAYAPYCGTGAKTSYGYGRTVLVAGRTTRREARR